jgi:glycine betaine/proline transport system permease protein
MMTLSSIGIAVPIGCGVGLWLGIQAHRKPNFEKVLTPILDFMQTVPVFAYLLPVLFLFGFSPVSAMIATIIYAMPPMVRATILGLRLVSPEVVEFGNMVGCSPRQLMWKVMIPAARPTLMVGVNQVIMLSLNAVIIASLIGAGGLGFVVLQSLRSLKMGAGLEAGLAIVLLAVLLDRMSQALATKPPPVHEGAQAKKNIIQRNPYLFVAILIILGTLFASYGLPWLHELPESATITTAPFWDNLIRWLSINIYGATEAIKGFLVLNIMVPFKRFLLDVPWTVVVAFVVLLGWRLGGWKLALTIGFLATFIALSGFWQKAMITVYLIGIAVVIAALIGLPLGIWAAHNERVSRVMRVVVDTLQTLPSFVYLMPVVMLFQVGDVSAMIAVIAYAVAPAIRYTDHGLRKVPPSLVEAAKAAGCSGWQMMWKVKVPLAFPEILLGINQTVMLAISMLVITALVGTRDLGQEVYIGLSRADTGRGLVAGFCVAFIAIITDRLIQAYARRRKEQLGID